jgi:hypothetical protein
MASETIARLFSVVAPDISGANLPHKSGNYENLWVESLEATKMPKLGAKVKIKQPDNSLGCLAIVGNELRVVPSHGWAEMSTPIFSSCLVCCGTALWAVKTTADVLLGSL